MKFDVHSGMCLEEAYVEACGGEATEPPEIPDELPPIDFDCSRDDGNYPGGDCSGEYFSCSGGRASMSTCFGDLRYDVLSDRCLRPEFVEGCGGSATTTTTPLPPPSEPVDFDCSDKEDGNYAPGGDGGAKGGAGPVCSEVFYSCSGGVASERVCEGNLMYDVQSDRCLEQEYVPACGGIATPNVETTTILLETVVFGVNCGELSDGVYPDGRGQCSRMYVSCVGGKGFEGQCAGPQTRFDPISEQCLAPDFVVDCGGVQTTTLPAEPFVTPDPGFDCTGLPDGNFARVSIVPQQAKGVKAGGGSGCTREYITCVAEQAFLRECPFVLRYDVISNKCLMVDFVEACGGVSTTPAPEEEKEPLPDLEVVCPAEGDFLLTDGRPGKQCSKYFAACVSGTAISMECAGNTRFDPDSQQCIHAAYIAVCGGSPTPQTVEEGKGTQQEVQIPQAPQKAQQQQQ
jgi:hypothetical protein